jgi:hypothetical protein
METNCIIYVLGEYNLNRSDTMLNILEWKKEREKRDQVEAYRITLY